MELYQVRTRYVAAPIKHPYELLIKRAFDVTITLIALAFLWPVMLLVAALIKLDSPGPALFVQKRIGKNELPFNIFKFRTMSHNLDDSAHRKFMQSFVRGEIGRGSDGKAIYKPFSESQVTRVGRILRKTSLDELPQLFNVLKGEMSLVGPRPNVPYEVEAYKEWHKERLSVLPGITGLAQVNGRSSLDFDQICRYDIEYARRVSLRMDIRVLIATVISVFKGNGAS
jgi:lipopolysaccharide/colanic/teichoic acid biosynthesis glycosyltransferase